MKKHQLILELIRKEKYNGLVEEWSLSQSQFFIKMEVTKDESFWGFLKEFHLNEISVEEIENILDREIEKIRKNL